jgi:hypothetical protein
MYFNLSLVIQETPLNISTVSILRLEMQYLPKRHEQIHPAPTASGLRLQPYCGVPTSIESVVRQKHK